MVCDALFDSPPRVHLPTPSDPSAYAARTTDGFVTVAASDGKCIPALSSYGSQAPFDAGSEVLLAIGRVPSMHTFRDDEFVPMRSAAGRLRL